MIPAGVAVIVRLKTLVAGMEVGVNRKITVPAGVSVMVTGAAVIVPRITRMIAAGMDIGINRGITVPAHVPVISAGAGIIVPSSNNGVHSDDKQRAGRGPRLLSFLCWELKN